MFPKKKYLDTSRHGKFVATVFEKNSKRKSCHILSMIAKVTIHKENRKLTLITGVK